MTLRRSARPVRPARPAGVFGTGRRAALVAILVCLSIAGCVAAASPTTGSGSPVDGIIVGVDGTNISDVRGFTLRRPGGATIQFVLGQLENPTQFPPGHLKEHEATSQPVRVYYVTQGSELVVYRLEDAPGSSAPAPGSSAAGSSAAAAGSSPGLGGAGDHLMAAT